MNFSFFKKKDKKSNGTQLSDRNNKIEEVTISERELLINSIGKYKVQIICDHMYINMEDISIYLLNLLKDNPEFLEYMSRNYLFGDLVNKINNGPIRLQDIDVDNFDLLKYPILFDSKQQDKINILRKDFVVEDRNYFSVSSDELKSYIEPDTKTEKKIHSYFEDIDIVMKKDIISVSDYFTYDNDKITILFANGKYKYNIYDGYYFEDKVIFDGYTIIIMSYDKFLNLVDEDLKVLSNYNLVIGDDYNKLTHLYNSVRMNDVVNTSEEELDHNKIMINHLLYCVNNSGLSDDRKKYYCYYISDAYLNDKWYYIYDYAEELTKEIGIDNIRKLTGGFNILSFDDMMVDVKREEYTVDIFLSDCYDFEKVSAFPVLYQIRRLNRERRNIVLGDSRIRDKLRIGLLNESRNDQYRYYDEILGILSVKEFISLYDQEFLKKYFGNNYKNGEKYKLFVSLCQKDFNETIRCILNDDGLFDEFFSVSDNFYSMFYNFDYDLLLECILKIENCNKEYRNDFVSCIPVESQRKLLEENLKDSIIVWLLPVFKAEVISDFFEKDSRALHLFSKFNITSLIKQEYPIKFNSEILKKNEFFELLKSDSYVTFRDNINCIEKYNDPMIIEEKRKKYVREIIDSYSPSDGMFKIYADYLNNPSMFRERYKDCSYVFNRDIYGMLRSRVRVDDANNYYFEDKATLISLLKRETSLRLSEVIVDDLFEDNIYNVWVNIKEMIRYNSSLEDGEKVLDDDKLELYNLILNIDNVSSDEKIKLYNTFKDKNYSLIFYEDLRKLKDTAYEEIKRNMFDCQKQKNDINDEYSSKYGVDVYDVRDKKFTMLVRRMGTYYKDSIHERGCYSIISDENTDVFYDTSGSVLTYGYNSFENDRVVHMFEGDAYSADTKDNSSRYVNRIMGLRELVNAHRWYSEVQILNEKSDRQYEPYDAKRPDYIVVHDEVSEIAIGESKRLNVPIVIIKSQKLKDENMVNINFDRDFDVYMNGGSFNEEKRRASR